jgi:predicted metal-dependent phosphoesterase TrpH
MDEFRADLHCHSTCSDGTASPTELINLACRSGLKGLSITDHDTIEAYHEAVQAAKEKQILLISGLEFSASHRSHSVHLLGYSFSLDSPAIQNFCLRHQQRRKMRNQAILDLLTQHGMPLTEEDLHHSTHSKGTIGRPHIALAMMKKGYIQTIQQAFQKYIGEGKPCYSPGARFSVEETVGVIHQAHGLAVIAHPHLIGKSDVLNDLLNMDFDGIEGYYARFHSTKNERWVQIGNRKNWLITGGSDFHGAIKPELSLGCSWTNQDTFNTLYEHFLRNSA